MNNDGHFYHAASKGLEDQLLFSNREQFIAGMNRVGLCCLDYQEVIVIAFVLMSNHVHFILHGSYADCMGFMAQYKRYTGFYLSGKAGERLLSFEYDCWQLQNREVLQEKIAYVLRNPTAAGIPVFPTNYQWGSGPLMYSAFPASSPEYTSYGQMQELGPTSEYLRRQKFGTKHDIPQNWRVSKEYLIWPGSYVDFKRAEMVFGTVSNMMYELNQKKEDQVNLEMYGNSIFLNDIDVLAIAKRTSDSLFGIKELTYLTVEQRVLLIRAIRKSHGCDIKQLGRLLHLKLRDLKMVL